MNCLYCNKRLGFFASKKRAFCSEVHEVAYHDEQAGLAMRRVMDPMFTAPVKAPPLILTPAQKAPPAEADSEAPSFRRESSPPQGRYLHQGFPKPVPFDTAAASVTLEAEPFTVGTVQLPPMIAGGSFAFDVPEPSQPATEPPAGIEAETGTAGEGGKPILSRRLHPKLEQSKPAAAGEPAAADPAACDDQSPLSWGASPAPTMLGMAAPGITWAGVKVDLARMVSLPGVAAPSHDPAPSQGSPLAGDGSGLDASLDSQLPLRYPLANLAIAGEMFEPSEELMDSRWSMAPLARPLCLVKPENGVWLSGAAPALDFQVSQPTVATPAAPGRWELPFVGAKPPTFSPAGLQSNMPVGNLRELQSAPLLPLASSTNGLQIPFAGALAAAMTPLVLPFPNGIEPGIPMEEPFRHALPTFASTNGFRISFAGAKVAAMTPSAPASGARLQEDTPTAESLSPHALPAFSSTTVFRVSFANTKVAAITPSSPASGARLQEDTLTAESPRPHLLPAFSSTNAFRVLVAEASAVVMTPSAPATPAPLEQGTPTGESARLHPLPAFSSTIAFRVSFADASAGAMTPLAPLSSTRLGEDPSAGGSLQPTLPAFSSTHAFRVSFVNTRAPAMTPSAPVSRARLQPATPMGESRRPHALPAFSSTNAFRIPFAGALTVA